MPETAGSSEFPFFGGKHPAVFRGGDAEALAENPAEMVAVGKTAGQCNIRDGQVLLPQLLQKGADDHENTGRPAAQGEPHR